MGYASLMVVMLMLFSILMFLIGIMGEYIGKMYLILCKLPPYKIRDVIEGGQEEKYKIYNRDHISSSLKEDILSQESKE